METNMKIGETIQSNTWRVYRFNCGIVAQSLIGAGKRGKRCAKLTLLVPSEHEEGHQFSERIVNVVASLATSDVTIERMREVLQGFVAMHPLWFSFSETEVRGVDVCALPEIDIDAAMVHITCDGLDFSVSCKRDLNNMPTLIPAIGSKGQGARFYAWLRYYHGDLDALTFREVKTLVRAAGIKVHEFCAMD